MGEIYLTGAKSEDIRRVAAELARLQGVDPPPFQALPDIMDAVRHSVDAQYPITPGSYGERYWLSWLNTMEQAAQRHLGHPLPADWPRALKDSGWPEARQVVQQSPETAARHLIADWHAAVAVYSDSDDAWVADYVTVARFLQSADAGRVRALVVEWLAEAVEQLAAFVESDRKDGSRLRTIAETLHGLQVTTDAESRAAAGPLREERFVGEEAQWPVVQQLYGILDRLLRVLPSRGGGRWLWDCASILVYTAGVRALVRRPLEDASAMPAFYLMRGLGWLYEKLAAQGIGPDMDMDEAVGQASLALVQAYRQATGRRSGQPAERTGFSGSDD